MRYSAFLPIFATVALGSHAQAATPPNRDHAASPKPAFDLAAMKPARRTAHESDRLPNPQLPHGSDLRLIAFDSPELDVPLSDGGPVMTMGALGSRYKNMPSLVHIGMAWDF